MTTWTTDHQHRQIDCDGEKRRWVSGQGGNVPDHPSTDRLVKHGCGYRRQWHRASNVVDDGLDQIETETLLWSLVDAGLIRVRERRTKRGRWEPYQWTATEGGERYVSEPDDTDELSEEIRSYLDTTKDEERPRHPALAAIRRWLQADAFDPSPRITRIVMALGRQLRRGRRPTVQAVSIDAFGDSKALHIDQCREPLEDITGVEVEQLFRIRGQAVKVWGDFEFQIRGQRICGDWSIPWLALTADTIDELSDLQIRARRIVTVENLAAFEPFVRDERPENTVAVFTSGFPGSLQLQFLEMLIDSGIDEIHHWSDLDVGGLEILRHLANALNADVQPFRMEPELLDKLPTRPLSSGDRERLQAWMKRPGSRFATVAQALLNADAKLEQEAWYLGTQRGTGPSQSRGPQGAERL